MQEAPESGSSAGASGSFSGHPAASIKEEDCSPEKERPPEAEYISSRCVLFTYFQGDISAVVDEHFSRALSQPSSFSLGSAKAARNAGSWRGEQGRGGAGRAVGSPSGSPRGGCLPSAGRGCPPGIPPYLGRRDPTKVRGTPPGTPCHQGRSDPTKVGQTPPRQEGPLQGPPHHQGRRDPSKEHPPQGRRDPTKAGGTPSGTPPLWLQQVPPLLTLPGSFQLSVVIIDGGNKVKSKCGNHLPGFPPLKKQIVCTPVSRPECITALVAAGAETKTPGF